MGSNNASSSGGTNDTQVSGYEKEINKQKAKEKAQKEAFAKYDKSNTNPNNNIQTEKKSNVNLGGGGGGDNNGNQVVQAPKVTGPTTAEVSQVASVPEVTSEEARALANELILKKRRGRGRSLNMLKTSSQGLKNEGLTLSQKTLLG